MKAAILIDEVQDLYASWPFLFECTGAIGPNRFAVGIGGWACEKVWRKNISFLHGH